MVNDHLVHIFFYHIHVLMSDIKVSDDYWLKNFDTKTKQYIITFCNNEYIELMSNVSYKKPKDKLRLLKRLVHTGGFSNKQLDYEIFQKLCGMLINNTWPECIKLAKDLHTKHYKQLKIISTT